MQWQQAKQYVRRQWQWWWWWLWWCHLVLILGGQTNSLVGEFGFGCMHFRVSQLISNVEKLHAQPARKRLRTQNIADASCSKALLCLHDLHQSDRGRLPTLHRLDWLSKHEQLLPIEHSPRVDKHRELESELTRPRGCTCRATGRSLR